MTAQKYYHQGNDEMAGMYLSGMLTAIKAALKGE